MSCNFCEQACEKLLYCDACKGAVYCNRDCQLADWKQGGQIGVHQRLCSYRKYIEKFNQGFVAHETWLEFAKTPSRLKARLDYQRLPDLLVPFHDELKLDGFGEFDPQHVVVALVFDSFREMCQHVNEPTNARGRVLLMTQADIQATCPKSNWDLLNNQSAMFVGGGRKGFLATRSNASDVGDPRLVIWTRGPIDKFEIMM